MHRENSETIDSRELIAALGVSRRRLDRWIRQGLPSVGRGKQRRFQPAAVAKWLQAHGLTECSKPDDRLPAARYAARLESDILRVRAELESLDLPAADVAFEQLSALAAVLIKRLLDPGDPTPKRG